MASIDDLLTSLGINVLTSTAFIAAFSILKNQPVNSRVYYSKWRLRGQHMGPKPAVARGKSLGRFLNMNAKSYVHIMDWVKSCLQMPESELIDHAGLDSVVFLRIIMVGLKIFIPMMVVGFGMLIPINVTDTQLRMNKDRSSTYSYSALDTITLSNVQESSKRLWAHLVVAYCFTAWSCWVLYKEYGTIVEMRFSFVAAQSRRPDQFSVLARCIPEDPDESIALHVEHFFRVNHPDYYLTSQVVYNANKLAKLVKEKAKMENRKAYLEKKLIGSQSSVRPTMKKGALGLFGEKVDRLAYIIQRIDELTNQIQEERKRVLQDSKAVMPAAFVSFETRWGAAVCAQTQQSKDSTKWLTEWAPEPRDVYWANLPIPYVELGSRKLGMNVLMFFLIFFYLIPVTFVQSLANLEDLEKNIHFLRPIIEQHFIKSVLQGFLPGLALNLFFFALPSMLMLMSKYEGHVSYSKIEKYSAAKYFAFMVVNVFIGSVIVGSVFEQLKEFINNPTGIPTTFGNAIPQKASFFITYIMVDGWTGLASELLRLLTLVIFYLKSVTLVKTERDRQKATPAGQIGFNTALPKLGLYFLLGFVYSIISPLIVPFILIYFAASYVVYRNQIINVYEQKYESGGSLWPSMFGYIIIGMVVEHITLIGVMSLKKAASSTPFLLPLPICTVIFYFYCKSRFEPAFKKYPLEEAKAKDTIEKARELNVNVREFLELAYMHPVLRSSLVDTVTEESDTEDDSQEVAKPGSKISSQSTDKDRENFRSGDTEHGAVGHVAGFLAVDDQTPGNSGPLSEGGESSEGAKLLGHLDP